MPDVKACCLSESLRALWISVAAIAVACRHYGLFVARKVMQPVPRH